MVDDVWTRAADRFRKPVPRWSSPAELAKLLDPSWRQTPALDLIDSALVDVAERRTKRLQVSLPPQEGKTTLVGRAFPLWLLTHRPDERIVIASYELETAQRIGRGIRDEISTHTGREGSLDLGLRVKRGDHAAARWTLEGRKGGVYCVGVGGALTGREATTMIIDDPVKDREQAQSSTYREATWNWWQSVARTRFGPDTVVVLVMTRWHAGDLAGRLLTDGSEPWRVISIPALADSPDDPLGRPEGEPLVSARGRTLAEWESTRRAVGEYTWASLYQQRPSPAGGGVFKSDKVRFWRDAGLAGSGQRQIDLDGRMVDLSTCWVFCVADLAASTRTSADYTVVGTFAVTLEQDLVLLDLFRDRVTPDQHFAAVKPMFERWGAHTLFVEQMMSTMTLTYEAGRSGIPVTPLKADTDKVTRALPAAARVEQERVWVPAGAPWLQTFLDELAAFPQGAHDDQCDVLSYAARAASVNYLPPEQPRGPSREELDEIEFDRKMDQAFGPYVDWMRADTW